MGTEPARGTRPVDFANMGRGYWSGMLFMAGVLIVCWFDVTRAGPSGLCADSDNLDVRPRARGGRPRYATSASPLVPRPRGRARTPPHARRRNLRLAARALRMESPSTSTPCGDSMAPGPAYPPGYWLREAVPVPTEPALPSTYYWPPSHFSPGTRGAHCGSCCRVWSFISTRCCYSAPSCFDSSLCWISPPEIGLRASER